MLEKLNFRKKLENLMTDPAEHTYLLAVSGGADSMVLAFLFQDLGLKFQIAHVNYKLRGMDSDLDQKVTEDFCKKHHIKFHLYKVSEHDERPANSIQLWAREIRYRFFREIQEKENLEYLVTAHHLNDQLETFIINLSKAAGINGLAGIPANQNKLLRPLLNFSKKEIYSFAKNNAVEYREDLSNKKNDYLRNKIRNKIVPELLETNDHFLENFKKSLSHLNQTKDFVQQQIQQIEQNISIFNSENKVLDKGKLSSESDFVKFEILKKYGFTKDEEISKIFTAETGKTFFSQEFQLIINRNELIFICLNQKKNTENEILFIENFDLTKNLFTATVSGTIDTIEEINKSFEWNFDVQKLAFPLKLRRKHEGDVFHPIGFSGKKKVSKFFKDEKLSILAKQKIWLLTDANNDVLGIIPFRQDKRYAADEKTKNILKIIN